MGISLAFARPLLWNVTRGSMTMVTRSYQRPLSSVEMTTVRIFMAFKALKSIKAARKGKPILAPQLHYRQTGGKGKKVLKSSKARQRPAKAKGHISIINVGRMSVCRLNDDPRRQWVIESKATLGLGHGLYNGLHHHLPDVWEKELTHEFEVPQLLRMHAF